MPKQLTQKGVRELCDEWAGLQSQISKAEQAKQRALDPVIERHNEELKPVLAKHEPKIAKLRERADEIEARVKGWLDSQSEDMTVTADMAVAARTTETKIGQRIVDVKKFLEAAKRHGEAMWECVSVAVAKAEKLLGKTELDAISTKNETVNVSTTLRLK